ncbi:ThiF family adenylyltransferase [bacterium]|nr:ThiF family adenylyltransferase [bacterium]
MPGANLRYVDRISVVGQPTLVISKQHNFSGGERFNRQSFLGPLAPQRINSLRIGIVGLSGGGSHLVQQLSHIGFADFVLFDAQAIDIYNMNRLVGATEADVVAGRLKVEIAERVIKSINSSAKTEKVPMRWQENPEALRSCDIVFGCVDGFDERRQLEAACRRFLIPLIDIGMDVVLVQGRPPRMAGQVILSLPQYPCFHCIGFLNERTLAAEAQKYGDAGVNPQVVWPNGVLAATAVGIAVNLVTGWNQSVPGLIYKSYDGNNDTLTDHPRLEYVRNKNCDHYKLGNVGDP